MLWISWTASLVPTLLVLLATLAWWHTQPKTALVNLIPFATALVFYYTIAPELVHRICYSAYSLYLHLVTTLSLDLLVAKHANMMLTGFAVVWLVRRAWQTLWKPVPELINILGVDVPDPPDVSLAGIRADAATLNWTRSPANRSVQKFLIQVNGVVVGDVAANQEPAIVVSGLKPNHFYNVRVIAVGSNNFQAGSRVIRLRTFAQDGRPQLGNSRLPSNFLADEPHAAGQADHADDSGVPRSLIPALETATSSEVVASPARDANSGTGSGPRRNTVTRRHSPSTTSLDQASLRDEANANSKKTLPELTEKFDGIRKETEDVISQIQKEEAEHHKQLEELESRKQEKEGERKKKEEQTEKYRRDVNSSDRAMRKALQRKEKIEKSLKDAQAKRSTVHKKIETWERQMEDMQKEQQSFREQEGELKREQEQKTVSFRQSNDALQAACLELESKLKEKRDQLKELEEARKQPPGSEEDSGSREKDLELRQEALQRSRDLLAEQVTNETKQSRKLDDQLRIVSLQVQHIPSASFAPYGQANPTATDFDNPTVTQLKRRSRNSNSFSSLSISSPLPTYSQLDPAASAPNFSSSRPINEPPGFAAGPYMSLAADMPPRLDEAGIRAASAPLSPSAASLLPSSILDDFDDDDTAPPMPALGPDTFLARHTGSPDNDPQSPASSGRSRSMLSSPHGSTSNLPFPTYQPEVERRGLNHSVSDAPPNKLGAFFNFQRSRTGKGLEVDGPLLGSLKQGQSQSFPRQADDPDAPGNKRRISLSGSWNMFNRNSAGPDVLEASAPNSRMFGARSLNPFASSHRAPGGLLAERDPSSPRPASTASSDFPRPSTDSGSIWGPPGDPSGLGKPRNMWSPDNMPWSRNPSRRPSLHSSPSALKTTLASADDEIINDDDEVPDVKEVGVIGSRPPKQSSKALGRLNPNAPAFIGSFFKPKSEKEGQGKEKGKAKDGHKSKDKAKDPKDKSKGKETAATPVTPNAPSIEVDSPSDSRKSRDGYSVHTQTSVSESHDSLSLDQSFSNTPSEPASGGLAGSVKDDNVVRKLFRKSSSGKFSLPGRLGGKDSSLFKKGPSSVASGTNSDRGFSLERSSIGDAEEMMDEMPMASLVARSHDSVTSSPGLPPTSSGRGKDSNKAPVRWLSNFGKKGKREKESLELERAQVSESDGGDEGVRL
ncbi:hypothetical protein QBC47DRAFT_155140 [Echria macrotheca]|uniref:Fibronectin type-III domain-containing protein n=1 Tax=Echria macrotheca TaxID=438768 RepID=A0AAJ0F7Y6_9PEZI|nr:hypothetical protein QBC47DRAFT_155140 [Echria macrotheca]